MPLKVGPRQESEAGGRDRPKVAAGRRWRPADECAGNDDCEVWCAFDEVAAAQAGLAWRGPQSGPAKSRGRMGRRAAGTGGASSVVVEPSPVVSVAVVAFSDVVIKSLVVGVLVSLPVVSMDPADTVDAPSTVSPGALDRCQLRYWSHLH